MLAAAAFGSRRTDAVIARPTATAAVSGGRPSSGIATARGRRRAGTALATKLSHRTRLAASVLASLSTAISLSLSDDASGVL